MTNSAQESTDNLSRSPLSKLFNMIATPAGLTCLYALFSVLWILTTDRWALHYPEFSEHERFDTFKGLFYVLITSLVLWRILARWRNRIDNQSTLLIRNKQRFKRVLNGTNDGWWEWDLRSGNMFYSDRWWDMLGYQRDELPSGPMLWRKLAHPEDLQHAEQLMESNWQEVHQVSVEIRLRHKLGHYIPLLVRYVIQRDEQDRPEYVSGSCTDISPMRQAEQHLQLANVAFDTTREGVMVTDARRRIVMINRAFEEVTGFSESEVLGESPNILQSGHHSRQFYVEMDNSLKLDGYWQGEIWNRRKDGQVYPELLSITEVRDKHGEICNYVGVFADISKLKHSESQLEFLATHDHLTELANRPHMLQYLQEQIRRFPQQPQALILLALDRFKDVNDSFGHTIGDELLKLVGQRLLRYFPKEQMLARLGGDTFAVVMDHTAKAEDAARLANRLLALIRGPWSLSNGENIHASASIGISLFPDHGADADALLQNADAALYLAKQEGRGSYRFFSQALTEQARERLNLESNLHKALENDELRVFFQPQVDIQTGKIVGAEALLRWEDPLLGMIAPDRFIPIAESTGQILPIGRWVLRQTLKLGKRWLNAGLPPITLAVNLSAKQLQQPSLVAEVADALAEFEFPAEHLELELTESLLMEADRALLEQLQQLKAMGITLALDDFGTGYSSLAYLKTFPIDILKIDRSFVANVPNDPKDEGIVSTIVAMGRFLGFSVLAEGIETQEQLRFIKDQGGNRYQGYLFSKPLPAHEFAQLLRTAD